jgi:Tol biopolymer transport system component/DNA-binding winged helix-turn-helix (wHTH) protein
MNSKRAPESLENTGEKPIFSFGEFSFDAAQEILYRGAEIISIPPKTRELLGAFIENAGRILTKEDLMDLVWKDTFVEEANLSHHIAVLRKSLGEDKNGKKFIQTIPRKGYRFVAPVSEISDENVSEITIEEIRRAQIIEETEIVTDEDDEPKQFTDSKTSDTARQTTRKSRRRLVFAVVASCVLLAAAFFAWRSWQTGASRSLFFDEASHSRWRVAPVIEGKNRKTGNISNVSFAPDGQFIAFNRAANGKSSIFVKQIGGGEAVRVTDGKWLDYSPVWSSDGQRVAFVSNRDDFIGVWSAASLGGTPVLLRRLAVSPQLPVRLLKWSRDGNRIYYTANFRLYVQNLNEAEAEPMLLFEQGEKFKAAGDYAISPDESQFAFYGETGGEIQLFTRSVTGGEPRQVTSGAGEKRHPAWFAGGQQLAFSSNASGRFQIYALDLQSSETRQLTLDAAENAEPMVASDDRTILFHATRDEANIYSYSLESRTETALTSGTGLQIFPDAAPDASRVVFQTSMSATAILESDLKILTLDGSNQILEIAHRGFNPQWSPDGNSFAFLRSSGATANLWKASAYGQNETQLTTDGIHPTNFTYAPFDITHVNFNWSPDGKRIVYASFKSGAANVWTIDADGGEKKWTNYTGEAAAVSGYQWSPDSQKIVFFAQMKPPDEKTLRSFRVCWTDGAQTETIYETTDTIRILGWSQDGSEVFVAQRRINAETKEKTVLLLRIPIGVGAKPQTITELRRTDFDKPRLSPDAQSFIYAASDEQGESENLYLLPASGGGAPQRLTDNREPNVYYSGVTFAPDGKAVFYSKQSSGDAYALLTISN